MRLPCLVLLPTFGVLPAPAPPPPGAQPAALPVALQIVGPSPAGCPTAAWLAARAEALAEQAVVDADAPRRLSIAWRPVPPGFSAEMVLTEDAAERGRREVRSGDADCAVLGEAVALAVSILATPPPPAPPPPAPAPPPPPPPAPAPAPAPPTPIIPALTFGLRGSLGDTPGPALAAAVGGELSRGLWRAGLEVRLDAPFLGSGTMASGEVSLWRALAGASLCAELEPLAACGAVGGGGQRASGAGFDTNRTAWMQALGAGASLTWDFARLAAFDLRADAGVWVPLGETRLRATGGETWTAWPVSPSLSVGARRRF